MKRRYLLLTLAAVLALTTAQVKVKVKVGANPGSITTGATLAWRAVAEPAPSL